VKRIVLIGCNGGLGKEISCSLSKNGYHVIGVDINKKQLSDSVNEYFSTDLRNTEQILSLCREIFIIGELWGLVFAAGVYPIIKLEDYTVEAWDEVMNINLKSCFLISKEMSDQILYGGRIIFITSGASYLGSQDIGYSVSKFGLQGLAKGLAKHFGSKILVNTISPGVFETKMSERMTDKRKLATIDGTLLKRIGQPSEITSSVLFLLDENNSYMTGATIDINGGLFCR
jgi:3-oxoacyl-[acyl-carrier protein] reductase